MGANNALWIWYIFYYLLCLPCGLKHNEALLGSNFAKNRGLLSKAKYLRKKIKAGTAEDWMVVSFEAILAKRSNEHTGGRRKKQNSETI